MRWYNGQPVHALTLSQPHFALEGTYVSSGWSAEIGESGTSIEIEVDAGEGFIQNDSVSASEEPVELPSNTSSDPRRDVIYVTTGGDLEVLQGEPNPYTEDREGEELGPENSPSPEPEDADVLTGLPLWVVLVPGSAEDSSDLEDEDEDVLLDLRAYVDITGEGGPSGTVREINTGSIALDDGDYYEEPLFVEESATITVIQWGVCEVTSGGKSDAPSGVRVALTSPGASIVSSEETGFERNEDGIVEETASGNHYGIRIENSSGDDYNAEDGEGLAGHALIEIN